MNILDILPLATATVLGANPATTIEDGGLIYEDYLAFKAGKLKVADLAKSGKLLPLVKALQWEIDLLAKLVVDPVEQKHIVELATEAGL